MLYQCMDCHDLYEDDKKPVDKVVTVVCEECMPYIQVGMNSEHKLFLIEDYR